MGRDAKQGRIDIDTCKTYRAFGLVIASDFALETLEEVSGEVAQSDVLVRRASGLIRDRDRPADPWFEITPQTQYFFWRAIGAYLIEDHKTVLVEPHPGTSDHLVSQALLGLVMSLVLERRELLCLHAGAIKVNAQAAVLLGDKGAGKSTSSAAMMAAGHQPITDDLVAVEMAQENAGLPMIRPGFSSLKLWPDSVAALQLTPAKEDRLVHPQTTKIQKRMPVGLPQSNTGFGAAFVLRRSADIKTPRTIRLAPHDALQNVLRYTFMRRYGETQLGQEHLIAHMKRCSTLVAQVPVFTIEYPDDLQQLSALVETVERNMADLSQVAAGSRQHRVSMSVG